MSRILGWMIAAALVASPGATPGADAPRTFQVDASRSTLEVEVGRAGLLKAFGHDHLIAAKELSGQVRYDPEKPADSSVTLKVASASLKVADPEISEADRSEVQSTMLGEKVLDVARFPEISFASGRVTRARPDGEPGAWSLIVSGTLRLHGMEREVTLPVRLRVTGGEMEAEGEVSLLQTDYGITPVKAAGGMVKVKDDLRIRFRIHARETPS